MIDINKKYRTRDGREVRIYATDGGGAYPVHGAVLGTNFWSATNWSQNGSYRINHDDHELDLIEVRPRIKRSYWVNLYPSSSWTLDLFDTREKADGHAGSSRVACVRLEIDCEHGEGL
jgi:hypothetical protein